MRDPDDLSAVTPLRPAALVDPNDLSGVTPLRRPDPPQAQPPAPSQTCEMVESRRCVEELLWHMRGASEHAASAWDRSFAAGIAGKARRPRWHPTRRQIEQMERIVSEMFDGIRLIDP